MVDETKSVAELEAEIKQLRQQVAQLETDLAVSRRKEPFHEFFRLSLDMLCLAGFDGYFKELNPVWSTILGWSLEELKAKPFIEFVHVDDQAATLAAAAQLGQGHELVSFENRYQCRDGTYKWLHWVSSVSVETATIYAIAKDMTENKNTEQSLRDSQTRLQHLLSVSPTIIYSLNLATFQPTFVSQNVKLILGYEVAEFLHEADFWANRLHPEDKERAFATAGRIFEQGYSIQDYRFRDYQGVYHWIHDELRLVRDEHGVPIEMVGAWHDVTAEKQVELTLRRYEQIVETNPNIMALLDLDYRYQIVNRAFEQAFGRDRTEIIGLTSRDMMGETFFEQVAKPQFDRCKAGELLAFQTWVKFPQAGLRFEYVTYSPYYGADGTVSGIVILSQDGTKRKLVEDQLQTLYTMSQKLNVAENETEILQAVSHWAIQQGATQVTLYYIEADDKNQPQSVQLVAMYHEPRHQPVIHVGQHYQVANYPMIQFCLAHPNEVTVVPDVATAPDLSASSRQGLLAAGFKSWVIIPLKQADKWVGCIQFGWDEVHHFTEAEREIYQALLTLASSIVDNKRILERQRQLNQTLIATQEQLEISLRVGNLAWWDWHYPTGRVDFHERKALMLGYTKEELEPEVYAFTRMIHPDDYDQAMDAARRHLTGELPIYETEYRLRTKTGGWKWLYDRGAIVERDIAGKPLRLVGVVVDIDQRKRFEQELQEREYLYRTLVETIPYGIQENDVHGVITYTNSAYDRLFGYKHGERIGTTIWSHLQNEAEQQALQEYFTMLITQQPPPMSYQAPNITKTGQTIFIQTDWNYKRDASGQLLGFISVLSDITERKQMEMALRYSEEKFRSILETAPVGIVIVDEQGNIVSANYKTEQLFGYPRAELLGQNVDMLLPVEFQASHVDHRRDYFQSLKPRLMGERQGDLQGQRKTGDQFSVEVGLSGIKMGETALVTAFITDITERKQAEAERERLLDEATTFRRLVEASGQGIGFTDINRKVVYANSALLRFLDIPELAQLMGQSMAQFYPPEYQAKFPEEITPALMSQGQWIGEMVFLSPQGKTTPIIANYFVIPDKQGQVRYLAGLVTDITELKRTTLALEQAKEAAEAANRAKSEFLASMSHELRTPLNGILGYAQILGRDRTLSQQQLNGVNIIHQSGEHLLTLINDVLDLSKIEAGHLEIQLSEFNLERFLQGIVNVVKVRAEQMGLYFHYQPMSDLPVAVMGDEKRLRQILINLLGNAIKFTREGGVTFKVGPHYGKIRFQIEDTGIGIPDDQIDQIFQPFRQVGDMYRKTEGTGLGLSISKRLAEAMHSQLQVISNVGKGSNFWFDVELPVVEYWQRTQAPHKPLIIGYNHAPTEALKVLVVDDKATNRALAIDLLTPLGFEMYEADDGGTAIEQALAIHPDVILMDIVMPTVNGLEATRQIRQQFLAQQFTDMPVIIAASASAFENDQAESLAAGCDDFIPKPLHLDNLLKQLEKYLAIEWIYDDPTGVSPTHVDPAEESIVQVGPPPELARKLHSLALSGRIKPIRLEIDELEALGPQYQNIVGQLRHLVRQYQLDEIQKVLIPYI